MKKRNETLLRFALSPAPTISKMNQAKSDEKYLIALTQRIPSSFLKNLRMLNPIKVATAQKRLLDSRNTSSPVKKSGNSAKILF